MRRGVDGEAVENYLGSLGVMGCGESLGNMAIDAGLYGWGEATCSAIRQGILEFFGADALSPDLTDVATNYWTYIEGQRPYGWQDWGRWEHSFPGGKRFVRWAEPAPVATNMSRFAIAEDSHLPVGRSSRVVWVEVSPNPDVAPHMSGGCFYSEAGVAEEAYTAAESAVRRIRARRCEGAR